MKYQKRLFEFDTTLHYDCSSSVTNSVSPSRPHETLHVSANIINNDDFSKTSAMDELTTTNNFADHFQQSHTQQISLQFNLICSLGI